MSFSALPDSVPEITNWMPLNCWTRLMYWGVGFAVVEAVVKVEVHVNVWVAEDELVVVIDEEDVVVIISVLEGVDDVVSVIAVVGVELTETVLEVDVGVVDEVVVEEELLDRATYAATPATATTIITMTARKTGAIPRGDVCK